MIAMFLTRARVIQSDRGVPIGRGSGIFSRWGALDCTPKKPLRPVHKSPLRSVVQRLNFVEHICPDKLYTTVLPFNVY